MADLERVSFIELSEAVTVVRVMLLWKITLIAVLLFISFKEVEGRRKAYPLKPKRKDNPNVTELTRLHTRPAINPYGWMSDYYNVKERTTTSGK
ncbi:hypothetical protein TELCIR_09416 [Teladorsagia circumcincta]|uniref:Uncharacterized protein n=1 Tax=Teladorsagia circumcincta TaxID=45464 RepID=A0A2G9UH05_TELCI|nr:hypothetical protein TELCIR_09416 [Teladorsagia circumcincta]